MDNHGSDQVNGPIRLWQDGDIVFLKYSQHFLDKDYKELIASGSGPEINFLPPWRMAAHQEKHLHDFHAFIGTELPPNSPHEHLKLSDPGSKMNKPRASWVYAKNFWTVPYRVLLPWNKVPGRLQVSGESLARLRADIKLKYTVELQNAFARLTTYHMKTGPLQAPRVSQAPYAGKHPKGPAIARHSSSDSEGTLPKACFAAHRSSAMRSQQVYRGGKATQHPNYEPFGCRHASMKSVSETRPHRPRQPYKDHMWINSDFGDTIALNRVAALVEKQINSGHMTSQKTESMNDEITIGTRS
ncbi:hypothetical protein J7T55_008474 [Diaporthe amygdali]|uniref:uncharacterized protein n=1 Tax=Phomopsis amygdali TaxID=1214568 RepID=UPI0022FDC531|nr:uncharacterized protein J7T55_008474 [Diaporthe amygdali]KAJ0121310.1 hypothetical protein J7T55_008474 [Diaporthe amygdali]